MVKNFVSATWVGIRWPYGNEAGVCIFNGNGVESRQTGVFALALRVVGVIQHSTKYEAYISCTLKIEKTENITLLLVVVVIRTIPVYPEAIHSTYCKTTAVM